MKNLTSELRQDLAKLHDLSIDAATEALASTKLLRLSSDEVVTQLIENNIIHLESLRRSIEVSGKKDETVDVRTYGDTMASTLLAGVEEKIDYYDLVQIIRDMRAGQARRRVSLVSTVSA